MSDAPNEQQEVKEKFKAISEATRTCGAFKVFELGSNGTVYVGCGLPLNHGEEMAGEDDEDVYIPQHQTVQTKDDGARVIFTWPL